MLKLNLFQKHTAKLGLCANAKKAESEMSKYNSCGEQQAYSFGLQKEFS